MKKIFVILIISTALFASRGLILKDKDGVSFEMPYAKSYALLIGVSDYTNGWPDLESIPSELKKIKLALSTQGFKVEEVLNPTGKELSNAYESFIDKYGYDENNRLLFYFAGHGYTLNDGHKGYLVPRDAPNPSIDLKNFQRVSLNMTRVLAHSREMTSKHALFLFDSCFSGTIFKTRALPNKPPYIVSSMSKPVRQFITSGSANEEVPAKSTFALMFSDAIQGKADLNADNYVTGSELGLYLSQNLPNYENQTPQYGKIKDYELSQGDFVFISDAINNNFSPSFNCKYAKSYVEKKICANKELSDLDNLLSYTYKNTMSKLDYKQKKILQKDELSWIKVRDITCEYAHVSCIENAYKNRIRFLQNY